MIAIAVGNGRLTVSCCGFVDGTIWFFCRPQELQGVVYNQHKRFHLLTFKCFEAPNVLIDSFYETIEVRRQLRWWLVLHFGNSEDLFAHPV